MTTTPRGICAFPLTAAPTADAAVFVHAGAVGAHIGLRYRAADAGEHRLLHQAWHHDTRDDSVADALANAGVPVLWVPPGLDADEVADLRTHAALVARRLRDGSVPYAFAARNALIRPDGAIDLGTSLGLTCATFVLRIFDFACVPLIDENSWDDGRSEVRRDEDDTAQRQLVRWLLTKDRAHRRRVEQEIGCTRIRAEEVAAASARERRPVDFASAERAGQALLAAIQRAGRPEPAPVEG